MPHPLGDIYCLRVNTVTFFSQWEDVKNMTQGFTEMSPFLGGMARVWCRFV